MDLPLVGEVKSLKKCPEKQNLLERLAKEVEPIMKKRGWKIRTLSEFYPKNPNLLGVNINKRDIKIRLRSANDYDRILEFHDLIGTMLHELVHFAISPHDQRFYKLLDEIYSEYESLGGGTIVVQNGVAGFGIGTTIPTLVPFSGTGRKLGDVPKSRNGNKLGGTKSTKTLRELVLEAALRRQADSKWCGSESYGSNQSEAIQNTQSSSRPKPKRPVEVIDLTGSSSQIEPGIVNIPKKKQKEIIVID